MHSLMLFILIGDIDSKMDEVLGYMNTELEGRFSKIRSQETNLGNRHYIFSLIVLDIQWSKIIWPKVFLQANKTILYVTAHVSFSRPTGNFLVA